MKHKIVVGIAIVAVLLVGIGALLYGSLDSVVAAAIRGYGPKITGVPVSVQSVSISPAKGTAALEGLVVGNPEGFKTEHAFSLGKVSMDLDVSSLGTDTVHIREIMVSAPEIVYEFGASGSNLDAIREHVASLSSGKTQEGREEEADAGVENEVKLVIDKLVVADANIKVSTAGKTMSVPLPTITLSDIGKKSGGASPAEVVSKVMASISSGVAGAVSGIDLGGIQKGADKALEGVKGGASDAADKLKNLFR